MPTFMTLEAFLRLNDDMGREDYTARTGRGWVYLYYKAKASYEEFGTVPPMGATVLPIRPGFGGSRPLKILKIKDNHLVLECPETNIQYLSFLPHWWKDIQIVEND